MTVAAQATAYTPARGRLIVANGYCRGDCSDAEPDPGHDAPADSATVPPRSTPAAAS
ncbi:hypothetical protein ACWGH8_21530 [Nonomuraea muscovyensis]|uniref:Uncharacterized protein n=1 Tax=Nonomuraea muscovyensis TaxID=1124761 RepID=A0A7X0C4A0_9ACTN|nr:hypothetical protein [Nonomuraea muscovyensis]MBB6347175.1 hypothetical protein [Nonomuraea muscovyensis]